jgi:hypothetical protein
MFPRVTTVNNRQAVAGVLQFPGLKNKEKCAALEFVICKRAVLQTDKIFSKNFLK